MLPTPETNCLAGLTGKKEAHGQRDDHEKITGKVIAIDKGTRDRRHQARPLQVEDVAVAAEKFQHSIEGLYDPHKHDNDNEVFRDSMFVIQKVSMQKKDKEPCEGEPFEEFNQGGEGEERNRVGDGRWAMGNRRKNSNRG